MGSVVKTKISNSQLGKDISCMQAIFNLFILSCAGPQPWRIMFTIYLKIS